MSEAVAAAEVAPQQTVLAEAAAAVPAEAQPETPAVTTQQEAKPEEGKAEAEAPIEVKLPDGVEAPEFAEALKSGDAQKAADAFGAWLKKSGEAALAEETKQIEEWRSAVKTDKEIGGAKQAEAIVNAKKAITRFGTPELAEILKDARYGDHPEIVRLLARVGASLREDSIHATTAAPVQPQAPETVVDAIQRLYTKTRKE